MGFTYKYSPFNVLSIILGMISVLFIISIVYDSTDYFDFIDIIFSQFIFYPFLSLILWCIDYYFQKREVNFRVLFITEFIIVLILIFYFINGLVNVF
jgi:hypothetical protein